VGRRLTAGYGGRVKKDPAFKEPRLPAIAIWTVTGLLLGLAFTVVVGGTIIPIAIGAAFGLLYGLYSTRVKQVPEDD